MIERLSINTGALGVIILGLTFIAAFFVLQFIVPIILWLRRKLTRITYTGQELVDLLQEDQRQKIQINVVKQQWTSAYYAYKKSEQTLNFSTKTLESFSLETAFTVFTSFAFANEKRHKIFSFSWQLWVLTLLSLVPYLLALAIVLLIYLPDKEVFKNISGNVYYLPAEALAIIAFVLIIVIGIWWTFALQSIESEFETYLKRINNKALQNVVMHHFKVCSYLPFSWRLLV